MIGMFPKNEEFFGYFFQHAQCIERAAELLEELCVDPSRKAERVGAIKELEHKCDSITRDCLRKLAKSFITPLDREDIHTLISEQDDVMDFIDNAANCYNLFQLADPIVEFRKQVDLIKRSTKLLTEAVDFIKSPKTHTKVLAIVYKIYDLESEGDALHDNAVAQLYTDNTEIKLTLKWKQLLDDLEGSLDACHRVANTLEMIVLKGS